MAAITNFSATKLGKFANPPRSLSWGPQPSLSFCLYIPQTKLAHGHRLYARMDSLLMACVKPGQPCAACKMLRRRCADNCLLAPYFPTSDPSKFITAHKVFGASNIIKLLKVVDEFKREDAVTSMVYEANARLRDPVYGCTGTIHYLHQQVKDLQAQLDVTTVRIRELQEQQEQLLKTLMDVQIRQPQPLVPLEDNLFENCRFLVEEDSSMAGADWDSYMVGAEWEPLPASICDFTWFSGESSPSVKQISGS